MLIVGVLYDQLLIFRCFNQHSHIKKPSIRGRLLFLKCNNLVVFRNEIRLNQILFHPVFAG